MKIIVFGGAGFIGSALLRKLVEKGHKVACADNLITGKRENIPARVKFFRTDITNLTDFEKIDFQPDLIINLAFPTSLCDRKPENQFEAVATTGMLNILEYTRKTCNKIIYGSSISVYGEATDNPITENSAIKPVLIYGANKYLGELYTKAYQEQWGTSFNIIRISDTFGERDLRKNAINNFIRAFIKRQEITINGSGEQLRTYTYVDDMAEAIALAATDLHNEVYNVAASEAVSINTLLRRLMIIFKEDKQAKHNLSKSDPRNYAFDCSRFRETFGDFENTSFDEGLRKTAEYIRSVINA